MACVTFLTIQAAMATTPTFVLALKGKTQINDMLTGYGQ